MDHEFGKRLTQARLGRGMTVEDAAHATRMRPGLIRALEDSNLTHFPNAAYAKSFLLMYAKYLGVDMSHVAGGIDTSTQVRVEDFQYLTSLAAEDQRKQREAAADDSRYDFVVARKNDRSWWPLILLVLLATLGGTGFVVWSNLNRFDGPPAAAKTSATPAAEPAKEPGAVARATPATPAPTAAAVPAPVAIAAAAPEGLAAHEPAAGPDAIAGRDPVLRMPREQTAPAAGTAADAPPPVTGNATSITPPAVATGQTYPAAAPMPAAVGPYQRLADHTPTPPAPEAAAPVVEETTAPPVAPGTIVLEPRKKAWLVIRTGPGGQLLYEDFLYPTAKPMHLPPGRYFIELRESTAVEISKDGRNIAYTPPGILVE